jgi:CBS domain-containing protein
MKTFATPVSESMSSPVMTITDVESVAAVEKKLATLGISALAVLDQSGGLVGVVTRTDLVRVGRVRLRNGHRRRVLTLPDVPVRQIMTPTVEIIAPTATLGEAARRMLRQHVHRLFISKDRRPEGVIGTKELMQGVVDERIATPIAELMNPSVVVVRASDPLSLAIDRMALSHPHGLVVVDEEWPVGLFTQEDALAARDAPPNELVERFMDPQLVSMPLAMPAFRAAEQAVATRARRILAVDGSGVRGIVTGMDFARLASERTT